MGNCFSNCRRRRKTAGDDYYRRSSPTPSGHLRHAHPTSPMDGTTTATMTSSSSGHCSPSCLTSAEVSVCSEASGPSTQCLTSAEVKTNDTAQEPSGPCSPSRLTSAEVNVCPEASGPSTPCLTSAEVKTNDTAQEPSGPCSPSRLTSAEVSVCPEASGPWTPACLASAEVETAESWKTNNSGPSESWESDNEGPSESWETDNAGPSESWESDNEGPSESWESDNSGPSESWETDNAGPSESWENEDSETAERQSPVCLTSAQTTGYDITLPTCHNTINLSSFTLHIVLGEGSFGKVVLATHQQSQQKVAIKSVIKSAEDHEIKTERYVLERAAGSPFLTQLYATFQTNVAACFVMEYLCGGTLLDFSEDYAPLDSDTIRFIVAEISCGLLYLHSRGILHG